ncbi:aminopeptidase N-like [Periplaneta americana]|uniref:aminopeptidase N-like n=1 Tax=Periplaneta americana TaxID=6978 RepID=UPI0037E7D2C7
MGQLWQYTVALLLVILAAESSVIQFRDTLPLTRTVDTQAGEEYRLPRTVLPEHYSITIKPDFDTFTFEGTVDIDVVVTEDVPSIKLHYAIMDINEILVSDLGGENVTINGTYDETTNIYDIASELNFTAGNYTIHIEYTGYLLDDMAGFYRSSYQTANKETKWLATTQFEPTDARRAFPCFDEPGFKAVYQINIIRPVDKKAISNTKLEATNTYPNNETWEIDTFAETPRMSSYLIAFIVFDFKEVSLSDSRHEYNVWVRGDALTQAMYTASVSPGIIQFMENFTDHIFDLPKIDEAAIPDFSAGAMENWGLVTYRERLLLFKEDTSTTSSKQGITSVIAHEFSHQWFGDLVSPDWWKFLWLNEGFATYFGNFAAAAVEPTWRLAEQYVVDVHQNALEADSVLTTHPITQDVYSPAEITGIFDDISYDKAGSIIRTAEHFLSHATFVKALRNYLNNKQYQAATADDLFDEIQAQQLVDKSLPDNINAKTVLESWTTQAGYPVVKVTRQNGKIHISQQRFLISGDTDGTIWQIPITYTTKSKINFANTKATAWLTGKEMDLSVTDLADDDWIILNIQETGFYRVLYDDSLYELLIEFLKSNNYEEIHPLNRAQLLDDALNLARAGLLNYSIALELTTYLISETDYIPWTSYFRGISFLDSRLAGTELYDNFKKYVLETVGLLHSTVGFNVLANDDHTVKLNRVNALTWACTYGDADCSLNARMLFHDWMNHPDDTTIIPPDLRSVVYCIGLYEGEEKEWNFLWDKYMKSDVANEQVLILAALGCTRNITLLNNYLMKSITENSGIRLQDSQSVFSAVYSRAEGVDVALDFLIDNFIKIKDYYTAMNSLGRIITGIASRITTDEQFKKFQGFIEKNTNEFGSGEAAAKTALETAEDNLNWYKERNSDIAAWLESHFQVSSATSISPYHSIMLCVITLVGYLLGKY